MVRALWNRETRGEPRRPSLARDRRPRRPANRSLSPAADARLPERQRERRRPPLLSRQHRPAGSDRTASRVHPSGHDARIRARPCADRNSETREDPPHQPDHVAEKMLRQRRSSRPYRNSGRGCRKPCPRRCANDDRADHSPGVQRFEFLTPRFVVSAPISPCDSSVG